jgi:hypothetical protein
MHRLVSISAPSERGAGYEPLDQVMVVCNVLRRIRSGPMDFQQDTSTQEVLVGYVERVTFHNAARSCADDLRAR